MAEEFYSNTATKQGIELFYYAETLRNLLKAMQDQLSD